MDPAQVLFQTALSRQDKMNAVIDRGDSPVQLFYRGSTVFVTGGSGFIGKQLIEKLFRSCDIKKLYILMRPKKSKTIESRLQYILCDPVFDTLRLKKPDFADCIIPIEGDVGELSLGLSGDSWKTLTKEVDIIFHCAATVRFDSPLQTATLLNVRGTREVIQLAKQCINLKLFEYTSTAYSYATDDRIGKEILEQFYPSPIDPNTMIQIAETMDTAKVDDITQSLIKGWPNTYAFTKALAEELIRTTASDLPTCIIRPPIVLTSYTEPSPGWLDNNAIFGPSGIILGVILGFLHVFKVDVNNYMAMTPVDYVNNCAIASGWDCIQRRQKGETDIPIYTISNSKYFIKWRFLANNLRENIKYSTAKAIWYCYLIEFNNNILYKIFLWLLHYIPAYIMDLLCAAMGKWPKGVTSFVDVYVKVDKFAEIFNFFLSNTWDFKNDNVEAMLRRMSAADKAIYNCDLSTIDLAEFCISWAIGIRKYIVKDGLENTNAAYSKQKKLKIANYIAVAFYFLLICYVMYRIWYLMKTVLYFFSV